MLINIIETDTVNVLEKVKLDNIPSARLKEFEDELDFLDSCDSGHEDRLDKSFTNEYNNS